MAGGEDSREERDEVVTAVPTRDGVVTVVILSETACGAIGGFTAADINFLFLSGGGFPFSSSCASSSSCAFRPCGCTIKACFLL